MKKQYEFIKVEIILFSNQDVIVVSQNDNIEQMPDFPEEF